MDIRGCKGMRNFIEQAIIAIMFFCIGLMVVIGTAMYGA